MADRISLDLRELDELVADLGDVDARLLPEVRGVVQKGMLNIKNAWRQRWTGHQHAPALPHSITYETGYDRNGVYGIVGPDKEKKQGALGNVYEFGTVNNAPIPGGQPSLDEEAPRFEEQILKVAAAAVLGRA